MITIIHPSPELNMKMSRTVSKLAAETEQREARGLVARGDFIEKVELDPNMRVWEQGLSAFLHAWGYEGTKPEASGPEEVASFLED